jgi:hypothetical protein
MGGWQLFCALFKLMKNSFEAGEVVHFVINNFTNGTFLKATFLGAAGS